MVNFGSNLEEFIKDFKERVVENAYYWYPKEYRKSNEYTERDLDEKFQQALDSGYAKQSVLNVIEEYYNALHEYEEILGF
jgi:hypothetical protein